MKQLQMTQELSKLIKDRVDQDIDTAKLAVFETIAINTKPLPGKDGTIFQDAVVKPVTLAQMVDFVTTPGNHLPLIADHELFGAPKGRFFHAALFSDDNSLDNLEMRALFYLDETEQDLIAKLNAGSLDEVSVAFLSSAFLCSECGFDYFSQGTMDNINNMTCANGHTIGIDGVHAEMVGLNKFIELSLVARGAADKPKIVGQSQSKLAPESVYRLAAKGFETNGLVFQGSAMGKEEVMDTTKLVADFADVTSKLAVAEADKSRISTELSETKTALDAAKADVTRLESELTAAKAEKPADYDSAKTERDEAKTLLGEQLNSLRVALGEDKLDADKLPTTIAELKTAIEEKTNGLTAIIPTGGRSKGAGDNAADAPVNLSGFSTRKNK